MKVLFYVFLLKYIEDSADDEYSLVYQDSFETEEEAIGFIESELARFDGLYTIKKVYAR